MATKDCDHCKNLSRELDDIDIAHSIVYCDDDPYLVRRRES